MLILPPTFQKIKFLKLFPISDLVCFVEYNKYSDLDLCLPKFSAFYFSKMNSVTNKSCQKLILQIKLSIDIFCGYLNDAFVCYYVLINQKISLYYKT